MAPGAESVANAAWMVTISSTKNGIAVSGSAGLGGFAGPVSNFNRVNIDEAGDGDRRLFLYQLVTNDPLLAAFYAKSDGSDLICQFALGVLESSSTESDGTRNVVFHFLILARGVSGTQEPFRFLDAIRLFHFEEQKHKGSHFSGSTFPLLC
ncbi:hypothetical protein EKO27_g9522 [Xylaria grammica]|uniref:Uncharacterized protein n=1 Tax=Xylaria grammica TaxID=363999 RepID=A0A439CTX3_9PEZI|nr:hypothetical protein EKO27_g9522 [Xylaria grammica]